MSTLKKSEKVQFIIDKLNALYPEPDIPLSHKNPYSMLIAVLLSAQCTDERVNKVTPKLFDGRNGPQDIVALGQDQVQKIIRPCGLSGQKSKAIYNLSKILLNKFDGAVPNSFSDLEALPGVGHKTASVVMSQVFGHPAFPVDTHIHRLIYRWGLSNGKNVVQTEKDCKRLFPQKIWNKLHLQIIYFGREYCPARGHHIENCPICSKVGRINMKR